jgi:hypothetical protein
MGLATDLIRTFQCVDDPEVKQVRISVKKKGSKYRAIFYVDHSEGSGTVFGEGYTPTEAIKELFIQIKAPPETT